MDTQAMSLPSAEPVDIDGEYPPFVPLKRNVFTDREREELKELMNEVLDDREQKIREKTSKTSN